MTLNFAAINQLIHELTQVLLSPCICYSAAAHKTAQTLSYWNSCLIGCIFPRCSMCRVVSYKRLSGNKVWGVITDVCSCSCTVSRGKVSFVPVVLSRGLAGAARFAYDAQENGLRSRAHWNRPRDAKTLAAANTLGQLLQKYRKFTRTSIKLHWPQTFCWRKLSEKP